jgi:hypothetical protein
VLAPMSSCWPFRKERTLPPVTSAGASGARSLSSSRLTVPRLREYERDFTRYESIHHWTRPPNVSSVFTAGATSKPRRIRSSWSWNSIPSRLASALLRAGVGTFFHLPSRVLIRLCHLLR